MSLSLAQEQQALLAAIWQPRAEDAMSPLQQYIQESSQAARGLAAYRSNAQALAVRALAAAYPVVHQLLGDDNFRPVARGLWRQYPPVRGDLAQWGQALATYIEDQPQLAQEPYLADVARAEWALHEAATAQDGHAIAESFELLVNGDPAQLTLVLAPGVACIASRHPVASIVTAHLVGEPTLAQAGQRLQDGLAETALVWRRGRKPMLREALVGEAPFLAALKENASLADSLAAAPQLDFNQWLLPAVQSGLVIRAAELPQPT